MKLYSPLILCALVMAGCGRQPLPPAADAGRARESLKVALDAWQGGASAESLQSRTPAIHVNEPMWATGKQLVKYEIQSEQPAGQSWRCEVLLTVKAGGEPAKQQHANYCIDTDPALVVVREP